MMNEKRFELTKINPTVNLSDTVYFIIDYENPNKEIRTLKDCVDLLNEQQATITELERKVKKYAKVGEEQLKQIIELQETETFTFPPNCDKCDFLGNNGICGYCKFTLNCYDSKEDLIDGEVLQNCPLKPLINVLNEQQATIRKLQDLCGESDGENAKLRIENKKLQAENEQLKNRLNEEYIKECSMK